jgi:predicted RNase H-like HicB family nuclease
MKYHFKIHKEGNGFWAQCLEIPGCMTQGDSKEELFENMKEALNTCIEEQGDSDYVVPMPSSTQKLSASVIAIPVDPEIALGFLVRFNRIKEGMTQKQAAEKLGMKSVFSYQRLEKRCNTTVRMIAQLIILFPLLQVSQIFGEQEVAHFDSTQVSQEKNAYPSHAIARKNPKKSNSSKKLGGHKTKAVAQR